MTTIKIKVERASLKRSAYRRWPSLRDVIVLSEWQCVIVTLLLAQKLRRHQHRIYSSCDSNTPPVLMCCSAQIPHHRIPFRKQTLNTVQIELSLHACWNSRGLLMTIAKLDQWREMRCENLRSTLSDETRMQFVVFQPPHWIHSVVLRTAHSSHLLTLLTNRQKGFHLNTKFIVINQWLINANVIDGVHQFKSIVLRRKT